MTRASSWPVLTAGALGVVILCGFGLWQLQRLEIKSELLASIEARQNAPPKTLSEAVDLVSQGADVEYLRVDSAVTFVPNREYHMIMTFEGSPGWQIVTPALSADNVLVLVDRGVVPDQLKDDASRSQDARGQVSLRGVIRRHDAKRGFFSPDNDPAANQWYWWDVPAMLGEVEIPTGTKVAPFVLQVLPVNNASAFPRALPPQLAVRNNHLQYALTWFSLAAVCAVMTGLFIRVRLSGSRA